MKNLDIKYLLLVILICGLFLFLCSRQAQGQSVMSVTYHPVDHGLGVRADLYPGKDSKELFKRFGAYYGASYGNSGLYKLYGLQHHITLTGGFLIPLKPDNNRLYSLSIGVNYHQVGKGSEVNHFINPRIYEHWSYELGLSVRVKKIAICVATDIRRWEPGVGLGFTF